MSGFDIVSALQAVRLPKGVRWINSAFDGQNVIATLAYGLEEPIYALVTCDDESKAQAVVAKALIELGASG